MKKILLGCLILLGLSGLVGCGNEKKAAADDGQIKLEFWHFWSKGGGEDKFFKERIEEFEKENPKIKITQSNVPVDDYMGTKLATAFTSGTGPDIFVASPGTISNFAKAGIPYPMEDYFSDDIMKDYSKASIKSVTDKDGHIIAVPTEQDLVALFYNKDLLAEKNIQPPKTWDELVSAAKQLTTDKRAGITFEVTKGAFQNFLLMPFIWQQGSDYIVDGKANLDSLEVINALKLWRSMIDDKSANIKPSRGAGDVGILGDDETAMWVGGTVGIRALNDEYKDQNVGVVPLPKIDQTAKDVTVAGGWNFVVNSKSEHPKEAAKFVKYMFLDKDGKNSTKWNTEAKFSYSPRKSVVEGAPDAYQQNLAKDVTDQIYGTEVPELTLSPEESDIIGDMIQNALFSTNPEKAAKEAQKKMQEYLDSNE
ncbi:sugar ABC transporter substrate-binding protein [Enterococcus devriesei]|uniref:ABC transporter substrate-binding protein n=1 Tax=Enterococcus devriesei TaxID=319970 RepID=UPI001C11E077|nr:sugar ABC transporter substrate-binding protein [Enterococcus devriesei]MBU5365505.1 sugar ABC transporter substrate-binding protein [Enterococcus devriesei]